MDTYSTVSFRSSGGLHMVDTCPLLLFLHLSSPFFSFAFCFSSSLLSLFFLSFLLTFYQFI